MTVREIREFIFEKYYKRIDFNKTGSYYSLDK